MMNFIKHKLRTKSPGEIIGGIIMIAIIITILATLFGYVIMRLWNWLMPLVFGLPTLTFWQAIGLFILSKLLLGGIGGNAGKNKKSSNRCRNDKKKDFSKWKHYQDFWQEEGETCYQEYLSKKQNTNQN